jgi:hypothetical protein
MAPLTLDIRGLFLAALFALVFIILAADLCCGILLFLLHL